MQGRAEDAVAPLEKAARTSRDPEVETQLAIALRQAGDSDKALTWLKRAVKRTPPFRAGLSRTRLRAAFAWPLRRGDRRAAPGPRGGADDDGIGDPARLRLLRDQRPRQCRCRFRARAIGQSGASGSDPRFGHGADGRGRLSRRPPNLFRRALAANADDTLARIALGNCLLELGEPDAAYACLRAASVRGAEFYGKVFRALLSVRPQPLLAAPERRREIPQGRMNRASASARGIRAGRCRTRWRCSSPFR